ncbi:DivIVA domain-containing protein [Halothermothrix orenii]|uniref:DivIVA family protein n=1 Tax=Halothermothrix orenii (strain H 168 / OCM 544 / DSM 9562) TaxID=373903 RepID=B8CWL3_HALOH|nr:DivIVA domain-containing protein [Halothermothrix orenii]ACL69682.1 DivIVA family protein [Halothermothrix orenii H 168]
MRLSPLDIYNKEFKKTTFGYSQAQVDEFLDEVGRAYERVLKEVNHLKDENEKLRERLGNYENLEQDLKNMMAAIEETAKEKTKQAQKEAEMIINRARVKADNIVKDVKEQIQEEYRTLQELKESRDLFKIRFKTLLESHLKMLEEDDDQLNINEFEDKVAASEVELDE